MRRSLFILLFLLVVLVGPTRAESSEGASGSFHPANFLSDTVQKKWFTYWSFEQGNDVAGAQEAFTVLQTQLAELSVENIDILSSVLLTAAQKSLKEGDVERALYLSRRSQELSPNYPPAFFFRSKVFLRHQPWKINFIINEYINGWAQTLRHAWLLLYSFGTLAMWILGGIIIAMVSFLLTMIYRYFTPLLHLIKERIGSKTNSVSIGLVIIFILIGPLWGGLGIGWVILWWLIVFWVFMTPSERILSVVFVVLASLAGLWLPLWFNVMLAKNSDVFMVITEATRKNMGGFQMTFMDPKDSENGKFAMAIGHQYRQWEKYDLAKEQYRKALALNPENEMALINLGNLYFLENRIEEATAQYERALKISPSSVEVQYNLAQAYREQLRFEEGEEHYQKAVSLNPGLTQKFTDRGQGGLNLSVVDISFTPSEALTELIGQREEGKDKSQIMFRSFWGTPLESGFLILIGFGVSVFILQMAIKNSGIPFSCALCGRSICNRCQKHIFHHKICSPCQIENQKVKRLVELRQIDRSRDRQIFAARILSVILPGLGHLLLQHPIRGYLIVSVFFTLIVAFLWGNGPFFVSYYGSVTENGVGWIGLVGGLIVIYLVVFVDLIRIKDLGEG